MSNIKKLLGEKIKKIRKEKNFTQEKLAELIEIETPSLSNIETGKFAPSIETLSKLSKILDVNLWEFYCFSPLSQDKMLEDINKTLENNPNLIKTVHVFLKTIV